MFFVQKHWKLQALIELKQRMLRHIVSVKDYIKAHDVWCHTSTYYLVSEALWHHLCARIHRIDSRALASGQATLNMQYCNKKV
jgi:hypothetical protein